jgi:hypothetical protein
MAHASRGLIPRLGHLARRFFAVLRARPLDPSEQAEVAALLRTEETALFWGQSVPDQRHGLESARAAAALRPERSDLIRAALLHDVGKQHARLGIMARSLASGLDLVGLPAGGRLRQYLEHGPRGGADLAAAGAEPLVVEFARTHHGERPEGITAGDWDVLISSDDL